MIPLRDDIPSSILPVVTYVVLGLNALVFLVQLTWPAGPPVPVLIHGQEILVTDGFNQGVMTFGLRPAEILHGAVLAPETPGPVWITFFTSMFMHGGWLHIAGNMLYLWIFADNVEDAMGHRRFVVFYLVCGVAAAWAQILADPASTVPMVGASGALAGVLGGYLVLYPHAKVEGILPYFVIMRIQLPAWIFLGVWIGLQVLQAPYGGGVAWWAHIGGFVAGAALIKLFAKKKPPRAKRYRGAW
jgi:membrane associated rhomboid family serine protease